MIDFGKFVIRELESGTRESSFVIWEFESGAPESSFLATPLRGLLDNLELVADKIDGEVCSHNG